MNTYEIGIRGTVTDTLFIEAENEEKALEIAHDEFNPASHTANLETETIYCHEAQS